MAVDVSRIPNNNKFDPVREAILDLQSQLEAEGQIAYDGELSIDTGVNLTGSATFTANQSGDTSITIGLEESVSITNLTLSGYLRGPSTFVIDPAAHGDDTGTVVIAGNLQVDGTTTTINSTTLTVDDKNIVLASGAADATTANGAGITIDGASATMIYASAEDRFQFNKDVSVYSRLYITNTANDEATLEFETPSGLSLMVAAGSTGEGVSGSVAGDLIIGNRTGQSIILTADSAFTQKQLVLSETGNLSLNSGDLSVSNNASVDGNLSVGNDIGLSDNNALRLRGLSDVTHRIFYRDGTNLGNIWEYNAPIKFEYYNAGTPTEAFVVDTSSNVSIPNGDLVVSGSATANSFVKDSGTQGEFLKADGSVTTLNVVTNATPSGSGALLYNTATGEFDYTPPDIADFITESEVDTKLLDYLPLAGGTLTGLLTTTDVDLFGDLEVTGTINAVGASFTDPVTIYDVSISENPRLSVGRSADQRITFSVGDNDAYITHQQDETDSSVHTMIFTVDSSSTGGKRFYWYGRLADGTSAAEYMHLDSDGLDVSGDVTADSFVKSGGTSSEFLKADGSVDSNTYLTAEADTLGTVTNRGATTTNNITVGGLTATGNLYIGSVGQQNFIAFSGTTGDGGGSATYTTTYIGERIYSGTERSELILYKGNDGHSSTSGYDRIRMIGANLCFDVYDIAQSYPTDLDGVAALTTTRAMTINADGGIVASQSITAANFQKSGGAQSEFLKADGTTTTLTVVTQANNTPISSGALFYDTLTGDLEFTPPNLDGVISETDIDAKFNGYLPTSGGTLTGLLTTSNVNFLGDATFSTAANFNSVAVFNGQVNYNSEDRSAYWSYDNKVAAVFKPADDDGAVAILFPSIGNSVSDFGYIAFDEDYGEAGVAAGENSALIIGCENDGGGSSDHVRVKGRLVVEADMSSSDPTNAFQVKSGNTTGDLFRVARSGATVVNSTLNVADQLSVDDAIRLTSNPTITGDSSGVYFWNQAGVGATIASNAFEVRTNGNTNALTIDNTQNAIFAGSGRFVSSHASNTQNVTIGAGTSRAIILDKSDNIQCSSDFYIQPYGTDNVVIGLSGSKVGIGITSPRTKLTVAGADSEGGGVLTLENTTTATGAASYVGKINFYGNDSGTNANGIRASIVADIQGYNGETDLVFSTANANAAQAEAMRIDQAGKVGIGTTSPAVKLSVRGDTATHQLFSINRANSDVPALYLGNDSSNEAVIAANNGDIRFGRDFASTFTEYMRLQNDTGRLGIGRSPSYKLDVNGNARIGTGSIVGELYFTTNAANYIAYSSGGCYFRVDGTHYFEASSGFKGAWLNNGYLGVGETNPQQRLHVNGVMRWGSSSYYAYSGVDGGGLYIEQVDNNTGRDRIRLQTRTNNSGTYTSFLIDAGDDTFQFANGDISLGREYGVTQLHNNKDYNNMASGLVWREYNATGTYAHANSSLSLSDYIKAYNFTEQGVTANVDGFTRSDDTYAVEFVGYYYANTSGTFEFSISSDDSGDFFIDGTRVAYWYGGHGDNDAPTGGSLGSNGGTVQTTGSIYLVQGFHRLYARFQEGTGGDSASLWHNINGGGWAKISSDRLFHKADDLFRATGSGNATLYGTFTATADIVAYSDERIKENVKTIDNALDKVQQLRGVSFNRIKDGSKSIGVIAQEIEKVLPEVVTEDDKGIKGVAYGNVVGVLIEAIKEQQKQIDELKARLDGSTE